MKYTLLLALISLDCFAASVTIKDRSREIGRENLRVSDCFSQTYRGSRGFYSVTWRTNKVVKRTIEHYQVEETSDGYFGSRSEKLIGGSQRVEVIAEIERKEFGGETAKQDCEFFVEVARSEIKP